MRSLRKGEREGGDGVRAKMKALFHEEQGRRHLDKLSTFSRTAQTHTSCLVTTS
jgi:hypothetical protein